ncbi:MAG: carotenoid oxygenase family protein [Microcystis aeruginosa K13-05]|uniref:carotenoid oxygenase family protein n=1 Tax=unclassified Microcystis TaxID=2643300 RepID=UPI0022C15EFA|nr:MULTISPECIES: carotenoid oxygenase family protein [unclassified Microcystis]MCZ8050221.1 carotenoid oxygenase family protein [Microcystis sp. LE19-41.2A]MCZ8287338.1 carotenoid oxygenase family protein [Microcystis sp. LE19-59.1C]NCR79009.1 carotenoid oxygenase family protein [Microcystis aeruginosa K13-10]NCR83620.1 carotenoid oxygenase family protein [Microcystis aeruginosa K13-05]
MNMSIKDTVQNTVNIGNFSRSQLGQPDENNLYQAVATITEGHWPENLSGYVFIVCPFHRKNDRHLFSGEGVIIKWDLQGKNNQVNVYSKKLKTWDSFWRKVLPIFNISQATFPAVVSILGCSEIANTAIVKLEKVSENEQLEETRLILTADAGRYWEVDPVSLDTITPIGYFDQHIVSVPLSFFPVLENTAHPFYDKKTKEFITCELKLKLVSGGMLKDLDKSAYIVLWDQQKQLKPWKLQGAILDGSPHSVIVTEDYIMIPDMPFQMGVAKLLGIRIKPEETYPKTQIYLVKRQDLKEEETTVPSQLITFNGDSYHFLCNYHSINGQIHLVAIQNATISLTEAIEKDDIQHFTGQGYPPEYHGIPWMFSFDPGVLRKVVIKDARVMSEQAFIHPGWFSTTLYTADPRELEQGYSAIYQVYAGYVRELICRRQYMDFRDQSNRILRDAELPCHDLPSVLAKVPFDKDWNQLTEQISQEKNASDTHVSHLGRELLDFYVCPDGYILDSIQFIPQEQGYLFTTVLTPTRVLEAWLFNPDNLKGGPIAKLSLPEDVHFGFTLHSEYFEQVLPSPRPSVSQVNRVLSALRSLVLVPVEFFLGRPAAIYNRQVKK